MAAADFFIVDDETQRYAQLRTLAKETATGVIRPDASDDDLSISVLSGGITNQLYRVKDSTTGKSVVVRVFGKETDRIISRDAELFWQSIFIKTFARRGNALVYEFLEGFKDTDHIEMAAYGHLISKSLAEFHVTATKAALMELPYATEENFTYTAMRKWVGIATSAETAKRLHEIGKGDAWDKMDMKVNMAAEAEEMLKVIEAHKSRLPEAASHNDLLCGNVMLKRDGSNEIKLIDFEYAKKNFVYYDIANHFNEYTGFECEWDKFFPTDEVQQKFITSYLLEMRRLTQPLAAPLSEEELTVRVDEACAYTQFFTLLNNLAWGSWAIIQAAYSVIDFDYLSYGEMRWQRYLAVKADIMSVVPKLE